MERPIAYDKLAREERFVRKRARDIAELRMAQGLSPMADLASRESIRERVHGILVGELQAMEGAGRTVCDFPDAPWEFTLDMARQVWDESRHVEIYLGLLEYLGGVRLDGAHEEVGISIAKEARRLAGFTDEEIDKLVRSTQRSPVY